jgi:hypothetical protein
MKLRHSLTVLGLGALVLTLTGCVVTSVYPYYFDEYVFFEPALLGDWSKDGSATDHWTFERDGANAYRLTQVEGDRRSVVQVHLFMIQNRMFLDLYASEAKDEGLFPKIPSHMLVRVFQTGPTLKLAALDYDWLRKLLEKKPGALDHLLVPEGTDKRLVLTADTAELRRFVIRHLKTAEAWGETVELQRPTPQAQSR